MNPIRRSVLAAAGMSLVMQSAFGRAPMAANQVPSVHRMKLGDFEVTALLDGYIDVDLKLLAADQELIASLLEASHLPIAPVRIPVNTFLVNTGDKLVLIDTGGARMLGPTMGRLPQSLLAAGIAPDQIDEVYITHMHGDHLHGTVTPEGARMFPNALVRISRPDYEFWTSAENEAKEAPERRVRFGAAKRAVAAYGERIKLFALGDELTPGIRSVGAAGHTAGHSCYMVQSGNARLLVLGDAMHVSPVQFSRPEVTIAYDSDQPRARASRKMLFEMVAREKVLIAAAHVPFPGIGRLRMQGASFMYDPLPWQLY